MEKLTAFLQQIGLTEEIFLSARASCGLQGSEDRWLKLFHADEALFYEALKSLPAAQQYAAALYLECLLAVDAHDRFAAAGIPDAIYYDSFRDLAIWQQTLHSLTGLVGLQEYEWTALPIKLKLFRIGRLQYEPDRKDSDTLWMHIPEGEPLTPAEVDRSIEAAADFFRRYYNHSFVKWRCDSWLLYPGNRNFMDKDSNILHFASRFRIDSIDTASLQPVERVFRWPGIRDESPEDYTENTRLQKTMKAWILGGCSVGSATGTLINPPTY